MELDLQVISLCSYAATAVDFWFFALAGFLRIVTSVYMLPVGDAFFGVFRFLLVRRRHSSPYSSSSCGLSCGACFVFYISAGF
jgi:hypothetical protein